MKSLNAFALYTCSFLVMLAGETAAQSCCDNDNTTTLCYLSSADYCASSIDNCYAYSLDGEFMQPGLQQKLISPANYGPNGIVSCNIELKKLTNPNTVQIINDAGCDIVFMAAVTLDPITLENDGTQSYIPLDILEAIKEWSVECSNNLVVASQGETNIWGYTLENANINPNTPIIGTTLNSIFDGPFGSITEFSQGGSFQGVFTSTPSTPFEILANDALGNPTVVLDQATNDLLVGDIGIFCTGPGDVSAGSDILTNNDVLVCNIFSLACQLAEDVETSSQFFKICPNETVTLPDGEVVSALGVYIDTLASFQGCDSIITTSVEANTIPPTFLNINRCEGDGYSIIVNGQVYDEANPTGQELLLTPEGCDSTVIINLQFFDNTAALLDTLLCPGETYPLSDGSFADVEGIYMDTLLNSNGCDSVVTINLTYYHSDTTWLNQQLCPGETFQIGTEEYLAGQTSTQILANQFGCDSLVITAFVLFPAPMAQIDSSVEVTQSVVTPFSNSIPPVYEIEWQPTSILSCGDCPNPVVLPNDGIDSLSLVLTDDIGCRWAYPIAVAYRCDSYIPNVFSPNDDGINDLFLRFSSGCPAQEFSFQIFDRWGEEIFYTDSPRIGWDGTHKGRPATQGVYVYLITVTEYGEKKQFAGDVTLIW